MNNEEKILEMLESLTDRVDQIQQEQKQMRTDMGQMRADMGQMQSDIGQMQSDMGQMQATLTRVALTQENIVLKGLDALAEGQSLTHQRLKDLVRKDELAELWDEVRLMRTVVAQHSRDIEKLKAAK